MVNGRERPVLRHGFGFGSRPQQPAGEPGGGGQPDLEVPATGMGPVDPDLDVLQNEGVGYREGPTEPLCWGVGDGLGCGEHGPIHHRRGSGDPGACEPHGDSCVRDPETGVLADGEASPIGAQIRVGPVDVSGGQGQDLLENLLETLQEHKVEQ